MKRVLAGLLMLGAVIGVTAQSATLSRYKVLPGSTAKNAAEQWNGVAGQGYRFLFEGRLAVMRRDAEPPDTYRYLAVPDRNLRNTFLNALNQQGAFGYGWVKGAQMLEKLPHPHVYEYTVVEGIAAKKRKDSRDELLAQGFVPVGRFGTVPIYMRDATVDPSPTGADHEKRVLQQPTQDRLRKEIDKAAALGYRFGHVELTDSGEGVVMEASDAVFEYLSFDVKDAAQLERALNDLGASGFRVVGESLAHSIALAERGPDHRMAYTYKVVEARDAAALEEFLNSADQDGFTPVGFAAHIGWTATVFIVVEKASPAP